MLVLQVDKGVRACFIIIVEDEASINQFSKPKKCFLNIPLIKTDWTIQYETCKHSGYHR